MPNTRRRKAERIATKLEQVRSDLRKFDVDTLVEIMRRGERAAIPDGHKARGGDGGRVGSSDTTSVESAALRGLSQDDQAQWVENDAGQLVRAENWTRHIQADPIGDAIEDIFQRLDEVIDIAKILDKKRQVVIHSADGRRGRESTLTQCQACGRDVPGTEVDRLRSGYCESVAGLLWSGCYRKWVGQERPDRLAFERWVGDELTKLVPA